MRNHIPTEALPRTFKDAIQLTRNLGVSYLWIDSLCIIQDSMEDWRRESRLMDKVYRYSACNIMAEAAINCDGGLFFGRDPQRLGIFTLDEKQTSSLSHGSTLCFTQDYVNAKSDRGKGSPLYSRGWVCQAMNIFTRGLSTKMRAEGRHGNGTLLPAVLTRFDRCVNIGSMSQIKSIEHLLRSKTKSKNLRNERANVFESGMMPIHLFQLTRTDFFRLIKR